MDNNSENTAPSLERGLELMKQNRLEAAKEIFTLICRENPENTEAWYQLSSINGMLGDIDAAGECSRRVLDLQPNHGEALANLGNVHFSQGKYHEAIAQYRLALQIKPNDTGALSNLGSALSTVGQYEEAAACYQACLQINPNLLTVYFNLGNLRMTEGKYDKAVANYKQAIHLNPKEALLWNNLGIAQSKLANKDDSVTSFQEALRLKPDYIDAHNNLANIFFNLGHVDKALDHYKQVLHLEPKSPGAYINLGTIYTEQRKLDQAVTCFRQALEIDSTNTSALNYLGQTCRLLGQFEIYFDYYRKAIEIMPDPLTARTDFMKIIENMNLNEYIPWLDEEIKNCFLIEGINYNPLEVVAAQILKHKFGISLPIEDNPERLNTLIQQIAKDDLLMMVLEKTINIDSDLEAVFTKVRRALLYKHILGDKLNHNELRLTSALARQGLNNEYVFAVDEDEERQVAKLENIIDQQTPSTNSPNEELECNLLVYGMYKRFYSLSSREHINNMARTAWSEAIDHLLEEALINPIEEEKIKQNIPCIASIEDQTSQLVQSQYEQNPYPRWIAMPRKNKENFKDYMRQLFPHFVPPPFLDGATRVLVAGCGTGQHPIQMALKYDNFEILAVDISKSSLAYAIRMARKYNVNNIRFMQGDILDLSKLNDQFDIIECIGVLHHMKDPLKGWKILSDLLVNNGLMAIGLYSEKARKRIVAAREIIKNEKLTPDINSIRKFRTRILNHEFGDLLYELHKRPDFHSTSGCRDLIFHFQEHRFTLPQIAEAVKNLGLKFLGFSLHHPNIEKLYRKNFPEDADMTNFLFWEQLESKYPYTFPGMYNFWCQKIP
jgi:tetratricopeptide (TPR) repeat protein